MLYVILLTKVSCFDKKPPLVHLYMKLMTNGLWPEIGGCGGGGGGGVRGAGK